jgi:hypothetical protein
VQWDDLELHEPPLARSTETKLLPSFLSVRWRPESTRTVILSAQFLFVALCRDNNPSLDLIPNAVNSTQTWFRFFSNISKKKSKKIKIKTNSCAYLAPLLIFSKNHAANPSRPTNHFDGWLQHSAIALVSL